MSKGKIRLIGAPPASGKSAVKAALAEELGSGWLVLEHEQVFTPEQRVKTADLAKVEMSSKEFVLERTSLDSWLSRRCCEASPIPASTWSAWAPSRTSTRTLEVSLCGGR